MYFRASSAAFNRNCPKTIPSNNESPGFILQKHLLHRHLRTVSSLPRFLVRIAPVALAPLLLAPAVPAQSLPDAPSALLATALPRTFPAPPMSESRLFADREPYSSSVTDATLEANPDLDPYQDSQTTSSTTPADKSSRKVTTDTGTQPHRILGLMPN